jgi:hypothetical protein
MMHTADAPPLAPAPAPRQQQPQQRVASLKGALLGLGILLLCLFAEDLMELRAEARRLMVASSSRETPDDARGTYSSLRQHAMIVERRHDRVEAYDEERAAAEKARNALPGGRKGVADASPDAETNSKKAPPGGSSAPVESLEHRLMRLTDATSSSSSAAEGSNDADAAADGADAAAATSILSPSWSESPIVRRQFAAFTARCGGAEGFAAAFDKYRAVYTHAKDPNVPAGDKRVLVVRDAQARGGVGLGHQQEFYARWLILGMTLGRAVFFQYCRVGARHSFIYLFDLRLTEASTCFLQW